MKTYYISTMNLLLNYSLRLCTGSPTAVASPIYIGETKRKLDTRLKEHHDAFQRGMLGKSAVAEHAWKDHHSIRLDESTVVNKVWKPPLKEAIHIHMAPAV